MCMRPTFPPAWIIVIFCYLVEAELLIIVWADPFDSIKRTFLKRGIDVARRKRVRDNTETFDDIASKAANTEFQSTEIRDSFYFLTEPSAHLSAGVAHRQTVTAEIRE